MTLIVTPGALDANSYCTAAEGDAYHATHLYASVWLAATVPNKEAALIWATRLLDEQVDWKGDPSTFSQALKWPRWGVYKDGSSGGYSYGWFMAYLSPDTIPQFLKNATAELARYLLTEDRTVERSFGITSVKADTMQVDFDKRDVKPILPPSVKSIVDRYGSLRGPGSITAKLERV